MPPVYIVFVLNVKGVNKALWYNKAVIASVLERWTASVLERWTASVLERWTASALERWTEIRHTYLLRQANKNNTYHFRQCKINRENWK